MRLHDDKYYGQHGLQSPLKTAQDFFDKGARCEIELKTMLQSDIAMDVTIVMESRAGYQSDISEEDALTILREYDVDVITAWKGMYG